jgi:hypothetical protein
MTETDDRRAFESSVHAEMAAQGGDLAVLAATAEWMSATQPLHYSYHFK